MQNDPLNISKLSAARNQLETAVRLYFFNQDPISIHTLAAASHSILHSLYESTNHRDLILRGEMLKEYKEKYKKILNKAANFFKHADKDPNEFLDFNPEVSELFIWEACIMYTALTGEYLPILKTYHQWFIIKNLSWFKKECINKIILETQKLKLDIPKDKSEFFKLAIVANFAPYPL